MSILRVGTNLLPWRQQRQWQLIGMLLCSALLPGLSAYVFFMQRQQQPPCPPPLQQLPVPLSNSSSMTDVHRPTNQTLRHLLRTLHRWPQSMQLNRIHIDTDKMLIEAQCQSCHWQAIHQIKQWLHHARIRHIHHNNAQKRYEIDYVIALPTV